MAKAVKKKAKIAKKSAPMSAKTKLAAKSAKPAKSSKSAKAAKAAKTAKKPAPKKAPARKVDPLNSTQYRAVTPMLVSADIAKAINFYTAAFGFKVKSKMDTPQGIMHAELTLRDTTLMLGPESPEQHSLSAKSLGNTPVTLYVLVEDVDAVVKKAVTAGASVLMPVEDMFWGDRCGIVADLEGNKWMIATHKAEPTEQEMAEAMRQMMSQPQAASAAAGN